MPPTGLPPQVQMMNLVSNFWVTRAIHAAAYFGIADQLKDGPKTVEAIASATHTNAAALYRVLRALSSIGIFERNGDGSFSQTPLSATLVSDAPGSVRYFAMAELGQEHYSAWEDFPHSVATGEMAFTHKYKMQAWEYYAKNPEHAAVFNNSMSKLTEGVEKEVLAAYDFSPFRTIADIGGGHGEFLSSILNANPTAQGILFDSEAVITGSTRLAGVSTRSKLVSGNFFESVPSGADAYTLKWILHDWNEDECTQILVNIRNAMNPGGRVLICEFVVPEDNQPSLGKWIDLNMMVMTGGRERTAAEFETLLTRAGFELVRIVPTGSGFSVIEGKSR